VDSVTWLQVSQWDQSEGLSARQDWFGGAGYGSHGRPDLSNTQMMLDALYDAGLSPDEPVFQKALAFASRTQNLKATNKAEWAGNDGGFIYTPANGGESFASETAGEGRYGEIKVAAGQPRSLRSYGSMTYAGFKAMVFAGLSRDDARVSAAYNWIRQNWTFDQNPGLGQQGLYYYYHTMARALNAAGVHEVSDLEGQRHNWRAELIEALLKRQNEDGSWVNKEEERWMEDSTVLVTVYSTLALEEALKPAQQ
jgi:squalene-hopene/tetraprenyl-beta-curcumene cyclase